MKRELDVRLARARIESLARWWNEATEEARYQTLKKATLEGSPPLADLRLAIVLAEAEKGQIAEG